MGGWSGEPDRTSSSRALPRSQSAHLYRDNTGGFSTRYLAHHIMPAQTVPWACQRVDGKQYPGGQGALLLTIVDQQVVAAAAQLADSPRKDLFTSERRVPLIPLVVYPHFFPVEDVVHRRNALHYHHQTAFAHASEKTYVANHFAWKRNSTKGTRIDIAIILYI